MFRITNNRTGWSAEFSESHLEEYRAAYERGQGKSLESTHTIEDITPVPPQETVEHTKKKKSKMSERG